MKIKSKKIGLFFGSFNPVHTGHMIIANHVLNFTELDKIWMVVSPQNPHKIKKSLANEYDRFHLVKLAIGDNDDINVSDIEFQLPKPSFTIDTLMYLKEKYPHHIFSLIMGGDNLTNFHKWKNYRSILDNFTIHIYKRPMYPIDNFKNHKSIFVLEDAPLLHISASYIRKLVKNGNSIRYLVPETVFQYLTNSNMYKE